MGTRTTATSFECPSATVIIDNLNLGRAAFGPCEADAVAFVDPNAMLPGSVSLERLQAIAGRNSEVG